MIFVFSQADLSNGNIKQVVYINTLGVLGKKSLSVDFYLDVLVKFFDINTFSFYSPSEYGK